MNSMGFGKEAESMGAITKGVQKLRSVFTEPLATLLASIIGGVCALAAAFGPAWLESRKSSLPTASMTAPATPSGVSLPSASISWSEPASTSALPNLTYGVWTIYASTDEAGTDFSSSIIKFSSQQKTDDGLKVAGFFEWRDREKLLGRETFIGNYVASSRQLFLEGQAVEDATGRLAIGSYAAKLSEDGRKFIEGTWGNTPGNASGILGGWEARR